MKKCWTRSWTQAAAHSYYGGLDLTPMGTGGDPEVVREGRGSLQALGLRSRP